MSILKTIKNALKNKGRKIKGVIKRQLVGDLPKPESHIEIISAFIFSEAIEGDYLEFGVFRGESFIAAYKALEAAKALWTADETNQLAYTDKKRALNSFVVKKDAIRYFAFDSFDGLPELKGIDKAAPRFSKGRYDCSEHDFLSILKENNVDLNKVITVPGWYDKTLITETKKKYKINKAAVVMVDCDLYESTKYVLDFITGIIVDGTIIIFDDWFDFKGHPEMGEQKATKEWLCQNPHIHLTEYHFFGASQKSFIVHILNKEVKA